MLCSACSMCCTCLEPPPAAGTTRIVDTERALVSSAVDVGRVEVYWNYTWGTVSMGTGWDNKDATVACRYVR
jgi:hypothetical protein